jgi:hypothetical protein
MAVHILSAASASLDHGAANTPAVRHHPFTHTRLKPLKRCLSTFRFVHAPFAGIRGFGAAVAPSHLDAREPATAHKLAGV